MKKKFSWAGKKNVIKRKGHKDGYYKDVVASQIKSAGSSEAMYHKNVDKARVRSAESSKVFYDKDVDKSRVVCNQELIGMQITA